MNTQKIRIPTFDPPSLPVPSRARTLSGPHSHLKVDRGEDTAKVTTSVRRPTESHWEWIIDRATD